MQSSLIANIKYNPPVKDDVAVGFALFNYTASTRLIMNYLYTVEKMKSAGIPVFTIELVIKGRKPTIQDAFHVYGSSYLFQKENLLRILETKIPEKYTKLLFLDADIIFKDSDWYNMLSDILDTTDIVQCFKTANWLDITYKNVYQTADSYVTADDKDCLLWSGKKKTYHSGFGWAFTREWYNKAGFIDQAIIGSGDLLFSYGLYGKRYKGTQNLSFYEASIQRWYQTIGDPKISFLPVTIYHLFHGDLKKRQYVSRNEILNGVADVNDILVKNEDGVFELTEETYNTKLYAYFKGRSDDMID
jgi:hypothetical protein